MFLSVLMAFSAFGILSPAAFAAGAGSVTNDMWNDLADALRSENVKNTPSNKVDNVTTFDDKTGDMVTAAKAYFAVLRAYLLVVTGNSGSETEDG